MNSNLATVVGAVRGGGIVAYPTEAVYGLGCDPAKQHALQRLLRLKGRDPDMGFILIASDIGQLEPWVRLDATPYQEQIEQSWPGPITWVVAAREPVSSLLSGGRSTLAVRVTAHPPARALCDALGMALVSTSANPSGRPPASSRKGLTDYFDQQLDAILDGEVGHSRRPSEIRDGATGQIIREG